MKLPEQINVVEVGPRDGFQNVKTIIPTEDKITIIQAMIQAGIRTMEITSFVNPKWLPQMADAAEVAKAVLKDVPADFRGIALAPNLRGVENAVNAGLKGVTYVVSASESHNHKNVNRNIDESLKELGEIKKQFSNIALRVSLATSFGCPFEGRVPVTNVIRIMEKIRECGINEIILCDTIGVANPLQVTEVVGAVKERFPDMTPGLHFHDTRGMGIANIYAGLAAGVTAFETCVGGLGGCPFAPGSAGNTATEDMLNMLTSMNIRHNVDIDAYLKAVDLVRNRIAAPLTGRLSSMCKESA